MTFPARSLAAAFVALLHGSMLCAADPAPDPVVAYQGRLIESVVVVNGDRVCTFAILDSGGVELWNSGDQTLTVTNGLYSTVLGGAGMPAIPGNVLGRAGLVLRVTVNGQALTPDVALVPAMQARSAWEATAVTGLVALANGGTGATDAATARTNLGLGTASALDASQVVQSTDPRLTDSRTPLAHVHDGADITTGTVAVARLPVMGAAGPGTAGAAGLVPAPAAGEQGSLLRGDGTWAAGPGAGTVGTAELATDAVTGPNIQAGAVDLTSKVSAVLPIANGGTGQASAALALTALLPVQAGAADLVLTSDGTTASWAPADRFVHIFDAGTGGSTLTPNFGAMKLGTWVFVEIPNWTSGLVVINPGGPRNFVGGAFHVTIYNNNPGVGVAIQASPTCAGMSSTGFQNTPNFTLPATVRSFSLVSSGTQWYLASNPQ